MISIRDVDLDRLNSATKYPSIPTYHKMVNGRLAQEHSLEFAPGEEVHVTEKVDGANGRIVVLPSGDYLIGSRKEWLTAKGDVLANPAEGIVTALRSVARRIAPVSYTEIRVAYFEVYGAHGRARTDYSDSGHISAERLFDVAVIPTEILSRSAESISVWRDNQDGQKFVPTYVLEEHAKRWDVDLVPKLRSMDAEELPAGIAATRDWMQDLIPVTRAAIDATHPGPAEGVVVRNENRSRIVKIRFADLDKALRPGRAQAPKRKS